ncbi:hypothetical protein [Marmoricola sp. RAF53]|uniref:hypothetical protein n=1 Tax=Marmoricola sp. RAF53 TaxID=3233059 RepID=UPI003F949E9F
MNESLGVLLRRSADAVPDPHLDVAEVVAAARQRQLRRRRLALAGSTLALVGAIVLGSLVSRGGAREDPEPAPSPSPGVVDPTPRGTRPLVYASGRTVHIGRKTIEAPADVIFLDATDDGVVFVTEDSDRWRFSDTLWFTDGSETRAIGRVATQHFSMFDVHTSNPGSLVVWAEGKRGQAPVDTYVVYDTSRHQILTRIPFAGDRSDGRILYYSVLHVDEGRIYLNPDSASPGCWLLDIHACTRPFLLRHDLASGVTQRIPQAAFEAELRPLPRMLLLAEQRGDTATAFTERGMARFHQVGRRLVAVDSNGDPTVVRLPTGEPVRLTLPARYRSPGAPEDETPVVQWLDDHRIVLFPNKGGGDLPPKTGDLLVCGLPDGRCTVAVRAARTPYVAPG